MKVDDKVLVTGARGMLGRAIVEILRESGYRNLLTPNREELNLLCEEQVHEYICTNKPVYVFHLASTVFGLRGNINNQLKSLVENTKINSYLFAALAKICSVKKIYFAGTVASYPYPFGAALEEGEFFRGLPHYGEFGYAMAKRHAYPFLEILKREMNIDYAYGILTNLYGEYDTFDEINGHVIPSLIKKAVCAKLEKKSNFVVWGNPKSERDFLYVNDAARASIFLMDKYSGFCNISSGVTTSIEMVAKYISAAVGGVEPMWDASAPVGIDKRSVSSSKLKSAGFDDFSSLEISLAATVRWYMEQIK